MKKILTTFLCLLLVLFNVNSVYADGIKTKASTSNRQKLIDKLNNSKAADQDKIIKKFFNENKPNALQNNSKALLNNSKVKEIYELSENRKIIFNTDGTFGIVSLTSTPNDIKNDKIGLFSLPTEYTGTYTQRYNAYGFGGRIVYTFFVKGYFSYNGTTCQGYLVDARYERGDITFWKVDDWKASSGYQYNTKEAYIFAEGRFHWGLTIGDNEFNAQESFDHIEIRCDKNGNVWSE